MIEWLSGVLRFKAPQHIVVNVQGVGYGMDVPQSTHDRLPAVGEPVELHIYHYVREDQLSLYGFLTVEERDLFEIFIGTSGVGPKTSLGILSAVAIGDFARAIVDNNLAVLTRIPGVGRKTAERLVVELRDKLKKYLLELEAAGGPVAPRSAQVEDAIAALMQLGTKPAVAAGAVTKAARALGEKATSEELVREALKHR